MSSASRLGLTLVLVAAVLAWSQTMPPLVDAAQSEKLATPKEVADAGHALIRVHLPVAKARAWFHDQSVLGSNLRFRTGDLEAGKTYTDVVTIAWRLPNGLLKTDDREIKFSAGQTVDVDFRVPGAHPARKEVAPPKDDSKPDSEKKEGKEPEKKPDTKKLEKTDKK